MSNRSTNLSDQSTQNDHAASVEAIYTIQSLLSVCKLAADHISFRCNDIKEAESISLNISTCLELAGAKLLNVGDFVERTNMAAKA